MKKIISSPKRLLAIFSIFLAMHFIVPQLNELKDSLKLLQDINLAWVLFGFALFASTYLAGGYALTALINRKIDFKYLVLVQLASAFTNVLTPVSAGQVVIAAQFFKKQKIPDDTAIGAATIATFAYVVVSMLILLVFSPNLALSLVGKVKINLYAIYVIVAIITLILLAFTLSKKLQKVIKVSLQQTIESLKLIREYKKMIVIGGLTLVKLLLFIGVFGVSALAFGVLVPIHGLIVVVVSASLIGSIAPTPGGLGAEEAALAAGLGVFGIGYSQALLIALLFRLITFWSPILPGYFALQFLQHKKLI